MSPMIAGILAGVGCFSCLMGLEIAAVVVTELICEKSREKANQGPTRRYFADGRKA